MSSQGGLSVGIECTVTVIPNMARHPEVAAKRPSKDAARAPRPSPFEARGAYHRAGHLGRTRWLAPQGDGDELAGWA